MVSGLMSGIAGGASVAIVIKAVDAFSDVFKRADKRMMALGGAITAFGVAGAMGIAAITNQAAKFEQTNIAFKSMTGSAEVATKVLKELAAFAKRTPFTIPGIEQSAKQLIAYGFSTEDLIENLRMLGDVSAAFGVTMTDMSYLYGTLRAQGRAYTKDLNQFANRGLPIWGELAKVMGVADDEVRGLVEDGKIGFKEVEQAFKNMTSEGGIAFNMMEEQSKTFLGVVSNIEDSFITLARTMGEVFLPPAKWVAEKLAVIIALMEEHPKAAKFGAAILGIATASALVIGPMVIFVALMTALEISIGAMLISFGLITLAIAAVVLAFLYWKEIMVAIMKFGQLLARGLMTAWWWVGDQFTLLWAGVKNMFITTWNFIIDFLKEKVQSAFDLIKPLLELANWASRKKGGGDVFDLGGIQKSIDGISNLKKGLTDIGALREKLAEERRSKNVMFENNQQIELKNFEQRVFMEKQLTDAQREQAEIEKAKKEQEKTDIIGKELTEMRVLYSGVKGARTFGDVYNPNKGFSRDEFQSDYAYEQAKKTAGLTINIELVQGADPDDLSAALQDKLQHMIA